MSTEEIKQGLVEIISPYLPDKSKLEGLTVNSDLINDLQINSAHIVDIVLDVEEKFDVMIDDDTIGKMTTVGASIEIIADKLSQKAG